MNKIFQVGIRDFLQPRETLTRQKLFNGHPSLCMEMYTQLDIHLTYFVKLTDL